MKGAGGGGGGGGGPNIRRGGLMGLKWSGPRKGPPGGIGGLPPGGKQGGPGGNWP